ncbi:hypothetical protein MNBD_ACTINO01-188, partial [hydrothermal vent metagenome]
AKERSTDTYREGICCPACHDSLTPERESRFAERQRQIELADARGTTHLGVSGADTARIRADSAPDS